MKKNTFHFFSKIYFLSFFAFFCNGCVTVSLGPETPEPSKELSISNEPNHFSKAKIINAQYSWKNNKTDSLITAFSECYKDNEPTLNSLTQDLVMSLDNSEKISEELTIFKNRQAQKIVIKGSIDGVLLNSHSLIVKKNGCAYFFTLSGKPQNLKNELNDFEQFLSQVTLP